MRRQGHAAGVFFLLLFALVFDMDLFPLGFHRFLYFGRLGLEFDAQLVDVHV